MEAIISFDDQHNIVQFDRNAEIMFGFTVGEALRKKMENLFPLHLKKKYENQIRLFAKSENGAGRDAWLQLLAVRNNGEEISVEVDVTKFINNGNSVYTAKFKSFLDGRGS
ncbi:MAG: PAS domain S-box protein [candidate division Zixibacteria bacterium]|nr:PAS domain S-box protein [candidate division Zixibacteria bacterium]NIV07667.1 PAS domain S-box protein [candidate division Zixibacteria bacterium]NIW70174.1 PAS domain S-box protein [candidate division KSB1 bacterium]